MWIKSYARCFNDGPEMVLTGDGWAGMVMGGGGRRGKKKKKWSSPSSFVFKAQKGILVF